MGRILLQGFARDKKIKKSGHGLGSYHRFSSAVDAEEPGSSSGGGSIELPPVIRLRRGDKCKKSSGGGCPVSKIHHAMARAPGMVVRKIKGACSKVLGHGGGYLTDLFASNQLLMHFTAAPVSMHRKRQMHPTVGFRAARSCDHSLIGG